MDRRLLWEDFEDITMKVRLTSVAKLFTLGSLLAASAASVIACSSAPASSLPATANKNADDSSDQQNSAVTTPPAAAAPAPAAPAPVASATPTSGVSLTTVAPPSVAVGSSPGGLMITLTGTGFVAGDQVSIGTQTLPATVTSPTTMTAMVPATLLSVAGTLPIAIVAASAPTARSNSVVLNVLGAGQGGSGLGFSVLSSINPPSTPVAQTPNGSLFITVTGSSFDPSSVIVFNGQNVQTVVLNATTVEGNVPNSLLFQPGQVSVSVSSSTGLTAPLPFTIGGGFGGGGGGFCQQTCDQFGLLPGQCTTVGGIDFGFGPFDFGGIGGQDIQCGFDGCVTQGCN
jgi:hypothetical protein